MTSGPWGEGPWGDGSWGGGIDGGDGSFAGLAVQAIRENVLRVEFSAPVFFSGLLEAWDASRPLKWEVVEVPGTVGLNGDEARAVTVVRVELSTVDDGIEAADVGRFVNLILDRPMTPWPAQYSASWTGIYAADLSGLSNGASIADATYRRVQPPTLEAPRPSRDFANPQTKSAGISASGRPFDLGTFNVSDDGDYAIDDGQNNLRKRVLRRIFTRKNAFAHLPGYGVGLLQYAKKLGRADDVAFLRSDAEDQIRREPDVEDCRVRLVTSDTRPNLYILRVAIRPKAGKSFAFDVPLPNN